MREYDAFISYRHIYPDIKVANRLHKMLEAFRLPPELAEESAHPERWQIFMDNWELPVSADLFSSIQEALKNSRFLILLCSTQTPASAWVEQEVVTFASLHGWDAILPVLIEGTPEQSFPKPLLAHGEIPFLDVSGDRSHRRIMAHIRRRRVFLCHRLAGCPYDKLWRRLRSDERRKAATTAFLTAALMLVISLFSLGIRRSALENQQLTADLDQENQASIIAEEAQREAYESAERQVQSVLQDREENTLWTAIAEIDAELRRGNRFPAAGEAASLLAGGKLNAEMAAAASAIIEQATPSGLLTKVFATAGGHEWDAVFTPDSRTLVISSGGVHLIQSYPTDTFLPQAKREGDAVINQISISDSGRYVGYSAWRSDRDAGNYTFLLDPVTLEVRSKFKTPGEVAHTYTFLPGTETFYDTVYQEAVYQLEGEDASLTPLTDIPVRNRFQVAFPLTDKLFLLYNGQGAEWERPSNEAILFNRETGAEIALEDMQWPIASYSPNRQLVTLRGSWPDPYFVFQRETGEILYVNDELDCQDMVFSPDMSLLAVAHWDYIEILETANFTVVDTWQTSSQGDHQIAFLDEDTLACANITDSEDYLSDSFITLHRVSGGAELGRFDNNSDGIAELSVSPDLKQLVARTFEHIIVWQVDLDYR